MATRTQEPRRHHFVPVWYLKMFGGVGGVGVFDKLTGTFRVRSPRSIAFEIGLYDLDNDRLPRHAAETILGNVENLAAVATRTALRDGLEALTADQREDLAMFIGTQSIRVPSHRQSIEEYWVKSLATIRGQMTDEELNEIAGRALSKSDLALLRSDRIPVLAPSGMMGGTVITHGPRYTAELLTDFRWKLHRFERAGLLTCDVPVKPLTDYSQDGTRSVYVDIMLGPSHALILQSGPGGRAAAATGGNDRLFCDANGSPSLIEYQMTAFAKADRYVYGNPDNDVWFNLGIRRRSPMAS